MSENRPVTERPDERTWIFDEGGVRFFLLTGDEKALLIDSGMKTRNAKELAREYTDLPLFLLNTHADGDHTGSNAEFDRFFMHPAEGVNYYNKNGAKGDFDPVWDGDVLDLGTGPFRSSKCPGIRPAASPCWTRQTAASSPATRSSATGTSSCSAPTGICTPTA